VRAFDDISATLTSPMVIVTTRVGDEMDGCLVGFSTQCSIDPLRYLVGLSVTNRTYELATRASSLVVHMLHDTPSDRALASWFGEHTARDTDKFARCDWTPGPDGVPVLAGCDWFGGPVAVRCDDAGDHVAFVIDITDGDAPRAHEPWLLLYEVQDLDAGNPP
jgi:flavin reductase (DIM6/NTAB) family NADH-FMN oxidoreductase RutF